MTKRRAVHLLFTGGTISMRLDPETHAAVPALSGQEIVSNVHGLRKEARIEIEDYSRHPGPHVTPSWMWALKERVAEVLADDEIDGVVVTHGTDTLEETAYLLDLTLESPKPVVFCGAMRTISDPGWDGPANLMAAVRAALHPGSRERGVLIAFGDEIHMASEARKWHSQRLDAFRSPHGPLGVIDRDHIVYHRPALRSQRLPGRGPVLPVDLHTVAAGIDDALLRASIARGARGVVIEATGRGNVPPALVPALRDALDATIPVVLVTRCPEGRVSPIYGYDGGGQRLHDMGVIFGGDLPGPKARIKLMISLSVTNDPAELRRLFEAG